MIPSMDDQPFFRPFLFPTIFLAVAGWGALILLLNLSLPAHIEQGIVAELVVK